VGLLNSNWNEKDGGAFIHGNETVHMKSGNFVIFDPRIKHCAAKITTHEKRIGIDFTVRRKK
jgi:beta-galactosidase beta subunit